MSVPTESVEARLERLEVPVKHDYCRLQSERLPYTSVFVSSHDEGGGGGDVDQIHHEEEPRAAAKGNGGDLQKKSKTALKRDRAQQRGSPASRLCIPFARNQCDRGTSCNFSHDIMAYLQSKPPDFPGICPFSSLANGCPYGLLCRWASTHVPIDPRLKEILDNKNDGIINEEKTTTAAAVANGWWKVDGTVPHQQIELDPINSIRPTLNILPKDPLMQLRKESYDFRTADTILASLGIKNTAKVRQDKKKKNKNNKTINDINDNHDNSYDDDNDDDEQTKKHKRCRSEIESDVFNAVEDGVVVVDDGGGVIESTPGDLIDDAYVETKQHPREKRSIDFRGKTFLAPLTTVGNLPFRRLCKSLGADITCGEMALATNLLQGQASEWALPKRHPDEDCFGVQLCGGFGDAMARCAQLVEEHLQVDFVDVNFGCPIDLVVNKGAGSACLTRPRRIKDIVQSMTSVLSCPVTLKMRKGFTDKADVAHELIPQVANWGASAVILHGRTREQRYSKLADWEYIAKCASVAKNCCTNDASADSPHLQLIGNGDVMSWQDHERAVNEVGVATTYVARGALMKPWIFTEIKEKRDWDISASERLDIIKKFASHGLEHWGSDSKGVETTRKFLLEWLSFAHRYVPVGLLEALPQKTNLRPPAFVGRSDLETLLASPDVRDWVFISEMFLGPTSPGFFFTPKHKATSYVTPLSSGGQGGIGDGSRKEKKEEEY